MTKESSRGLSTSALARALDKTSKQMFAELAALGWIRREDDQWQLTAKGEFEKGKYHTSDKFGTYIVWPESVRQHPALVKFEARLLSHKDLADHFSYEPLMMQRLLAELGWMKPHLHGWQLTAAGKLQGGVQHEDQESGVPKVLWQKSVQTNALLEQRLEVALGKDSPEGIQGIRTLDGRIIENQGAALVANWLYLANIRFTTHMNIPELPGQQADFYLPDAGLYLEYWCDSLTAHQLAQKMARKNHYALHKSEVADLRPDDLSRLDKHLTKLLLQHEIAL
ncbi:hypothetical protein [Aliamphritea spongicola]|uniref:hypothetical protein n=1 Tax=Aliamphritea spongicola TaxID=707589 RepID=UPI00196A5805|nr:hypothetical protein [Aliamphritea spongicola]MBN3563215.1 hypothetical protein [Aliamphritea spongicola]